MRVTGDEAHGLRRRLWLGGSAIGLVVLVVVLAQAGTRLADPSPLWELGGDFVPAYAAGTLVRQGRAIEVYDPATLEQVERKIVTDARLAPLPYYGPYLNPPFFAAFYAPFSVLPYRRAAILWLIVSLLCATGAIFLMCRMLAPEAAWRSWALVPLLLCISMPFWQVMCHLQNTCLSLLLLCGVVCLWTSATTIWSKMGAGFLSGLLIYKPQIASLVVIALTMTLGWRALLGFAMVSGTLIGLTIWKLPGAMAVYLLELPRLVQQIQQRPQYNWGRQPTPMGFWRLLLQGHMGGAAGVFILILCAVIIGVFAIAWIASAIASRRGQPRSDHKLDRFISATICCLPLLMPYYMDYDLLLLAIPAVLLAKEWSQSEQAARGLDRVLPWTWTALFLVLYVNPGLSGVTRFNLAAPFVALLCGLMILRCIRVDCSIQSAERSIERKLAVAA